MATQTAAELEAQLTNVNTCINDILTTGQSYAKPGLSLTRANLADLIKLRDKLSQQVSRMAASGGAFVFDVSGGVGGATEADEWGED